MNTTRASVSVAITASPMLASVVRSCSRWSWICPAAAARVFHSRRSSQVNASDRQQPQQRAEHDRRECSVIHLRRLGRPRDEQLPFGVLHFVDRLAQGVHLPLTHVGGDRLLSRVEALFLAELGIGEKGIEPGGDPLAQFGNAGQLFGVVGSQVVDALDLIFCNGLSSAVRIEVSGVAGDDIARWPLSASRTDSMIASSVAMTRWVCSTSAESCRKRWTLYADRMAVPTISSTTSTMPSTSGRSSPASTAGELGSRPRKRLGIEHACATFALPATCSESGRRRKAPRTERVLCRPRQAAP